MSAKQEDLLATLNAVAEQLGAKVVSPNGGDSGRWGKAASPPATALGIVGLAVPLKVEIPMGSIRVYASFPGEAASSPEVLLDTIRRLVDLGLPVDIYRGGDGGWRKGSGAGWGNGGGWRDRERDDRYGGRYGGGRGYGRPWRSGW
jgi:hypothetical protein